MALLALRVAAKALGPGDAAETIDYSGRLTVAGQPFSGEGKFKFELLRMDGTRLWTNNDNEVPIEEGVPPGSVTVLVKDGVYRVRLGGGLGMKELPKAPGAVRQASEVGIWFDDGIHDWAYLGKFNLTSGAGRTAGTTPPGGSAANLDGILSELRALRIEVGELRRQLAGAGDPPPPALPLTSPQPGLNPSLKPSLNPSVKPSVKPDLKPALVTLKEVKRHSLGKADAPLVLVEFTDYECGYCKRFFDETFPLLKKEYIDTGKLRFVSRNMPAASHPQSGPAALALLGAAERTDEDYWKMRAWLFANQRDLGPDGLKRYAAEAGLDQAALLAGIAAKKHGEEIQEDIAAARAAGITGTPSFVLGTSDGEIIRGERIIGSKAFPVFEIKIRTLLATPGAPATLIGPAKPGAPPTITAPVTPADPATPSVPATLNGPSKLNEAKPQ